MLNKNFKARDLKKGTRVMVDVLHKYPEERTILSKDRKNGLPTVNFTDGTWSYVALIESVIRTEAVPVVKLFEVVTLEYVKDADYETTRLGRTVDHIVVTSLTEAEADKLVKEMNSPAKENQYTIKRKMN